jgi:hypothetical protein
VAKKITTRVLLLGLLGLLEGCDDANKPHESSLASPSAIASALGIDASLGVLIDPERPPGDLAADIAGFSSVEACMKQRTASLDPLVGDAVDAIGYDTFLRDACRVLEAAKTKEPKKCELIDASALRARCRAVTAMIAANADGCPLRAPNKPELGRDATCVAAALRSVTMCAGAEPRSRPSCEALVTGDPKKCEAIALEDQRVPCLRDATRFHNVLSGAPAIAILPTPKGTLTLHGDGQPDPLQTTADLDADIGAGVVVVRDGTHSRATFGQFDDSVGVRGGQPLTRTRLGIALGVEPDKVEVIKAALTIPGAPHGSCAGEGCRALTIKLGKIEPKRAGAYELTVDGTLNGVRIHADVRTFVRDVVDDTTEHVPRK